MTRGCGVAERRFRRAGRWREIANLWQLVTRLVGIVLAKQAAAERGQAPPNELPAVMSGGLFVTRPS